MGILGAADSAMIGKSVSSAAFADRASAGVRVQPPGYARNPAPARSFSSLAPVSASTTMEIHITERALARLLAVAEQEGVDPDVTMLRVAAVPGGCSGLTYDLGWDTTRKDDDETVGVGRLTVVMDRKSRLYIDGSQLDFTDGLEGKGFHFQNPQAARTCACGESFGL